jgi:hypothetical protein
LRKIRRRDVRRVVLDVLVVVTLLLLLLVAIALTH